MVERPDDWEGGLERYRLWWWEVETIKALAMVGPGGEMERICRMREEAKAGIGGGGGGEWGGIDELGWVARWRVLTELEQGKRVEELTGEWVTRRQAVDGKMVAIEILAPGYFLHIQRGDNGQKAGALERVDGKVTYSLSGAGRIGVGEKTVWILGLRYPVTKQIVWDLVVHDVILVPDTLFDQFFRWGQKVKDYLNGGGNSGRPVVAQIKEEIARGGEVNDGWVRGYMAVARGVPAIWREISSEGVSADMMLLFLVMGVAGGEMFSKERVRPVGECPGDLRMEMQELVSRRPAWGVKWKSEEEMNRDVGKWRFEGRWDEMVTRWRTDRKAE